MIKLLESAINNEKHNDFSFYLDGDLCQMSDQRNFLNSQGIQTKQNNVYPCLKQSDVPNALNLIWVNKVNGWWHYKDKYIQYNICTEEDFLNRLKRC